jgi:hypothetical protein
LSNATSSAGISTAAAAVPTAAAKIEVGAVLDGNGSEGVMAVLLLLLLRRVVEWIRAPNYGGCFGDDGGIRIGVAVCSYLEGAGHSDTIGFKKQIRNGIGSVLL